MLKVKSAIHPLSMKQDSWNECFSMQLKESKFGQTVHSDCKLTLIKTVWPPSEWRKVTHHIIYFAACSVASNTKNGTLYESCYKMLSWCQVSVEISGIIHMQERQKNKNKQNKNKALITKLIGLVAWVLVAGRIGSECVGFVVDEILTPMWRHDEGSENWVLNFCT